MITIARVTKKEQAAKFVDAIHGQSYMNFEVLVCPAGGEFEVSVFAKGYTNEEAQPMLNYLMFLAISDDT